MGQYVTRSCIFSAVVCLLLWDIVKFNVGTSLMNFVTIESMANVYNGTAIRKYAAIVPSRFGLDNNSYSNRNSHTIDAEDDYGPEVELWCSLLEPFSTSDFYHFPHAAQSLFPCWSWFERMRSNLANITTKTRCGFLFKQDDYRSLYREGWIKSFMDNMGCNHSNIEHPLLSTHRNKSTIEGTENDTALFYILPEEAIYGFQWFERPEDALSLRRKVLEQIQSSDNNGSTTTNLTTNRDGDDDDDDGHVRIAIVDRTKNRKFVNIENISAAIRQTYPTASLTIAYMEDMDGPQQFLFWSRHDIIIVGHGAAITNAIFMPLRNTSAVIEIFPHHFYDTTFFGTLLQSIGIRGYGYYNNETDLAADWRVYSRTLPQRKHYRGQDLEPPVDAVLDLLRQALLDGGYDLLNPTQSH